MKVTEIGRENGTLTSTVTVTETVNVPKDVNAKGNGIVRGIVTVTGHRNAMAPTVILLVEVVAVALEVEGLVGKVAGRVEARAEGSRKAGRRRGRGGAIVQR